MNFYENPENLKKLQKLLKPNEDSSSSSDDELASGRPNQKIGPGDLGRIELEATSPNEPDNKKKTKIDTKTNNPITDGNKIVRVRATEKPKPKPKVEGIHDEVIKWIQLQETNDNDVLETRKRPEFKIAYKQAVRTEDVFLQMNNRNSSTASCEDMVIVIQMPGETVDVDEMDLKVTDTAIDLKSSLYRLRLPLVQSIDPDKGRAEFDSDKKILTLTLRMNRELDFVNF